MNLALKCWFPQRNNTTLLTAKLSPYNFTYLLFNLRFIIENIKIYCRRLRLFISEWDETCDWLQTTAEHGIVWSMWAGDHGELFCCVHLNREWQFHAKCNELTDVFWLLLLTEHKVLHCYAPNTVYHCLVAGQLYPSFGFSLADSMLSTFQPLSSCTILNHIFLWNFHDFV